MKPIDWQEGGRRLRLLVFVLLSLMYVAALVVIGLLWVHLWTTTYVAIGWIGVVLGWECTRQAFYAARRSFVPLYLALGVIIPLTTMGMVSTWARLEGVPRMDVWIDGSFGVTAAVVGLTLAGYVLWWVISGFVATHRKTASS